MIGFLINNWAGICIGMIAIVVLLIIIFVLISVCEQKKNIYPRKLSKKEERELQEQFPKLGGKNDK